MVGVATGNRFLATAPMGLELHSRNQEGLDIAVSFLTTLKESMVKSSLLTALSSMEGFFLSQFKAGKLHLSSIAQQSCGIESMSKMNGTDVGHWAGVAYSVFTNVLVELMTKEGVSSAVHVKVVRTLMEFVRVETPGTFGHALYAKVIKALVTATHSITYIVAILESEYFQYADVRYFTTLNVRRFADERASMKLDDKPGSNGLRMFVRNLYEILSHLPTTLKGYSGNEGSENMAHEKTWCPTLTTKSTSSEMECTAVENWKDSSVQKDAFLKSWKSCIKLSQPLSMHKNSGDMLSRVLSTTSRSCAIAAPDSFLTSLGDEVEERLMQLAACKDSTTDDLFPVKGLRCGRSIEAADWMVSAARGKDDDDDDDDDDDEDEDEDEDDDDDAKDAGGEDDDVEGEEGEEEGEDEEEDDDGEADDNGEDDDGEEEDGEDDDGDEDAEGEEEEDDEDGDHDEDDDDEDAEGESEEDVEPPKKKRK